MIKAGGLCFLLYCLPANVHQLSMYRVSYGNIHSRAHFLRRNIHKILDFDSLYWICYFEMNDKI